MTAIDSAVIQAKALPFLLQEQTGKEQVSYEDWSTACD